MVSDEQREKVPEFIQYFYLTGLGICYPIENYWSQWFITLAFSHATSSAIRRIGGKVYAGNTYGIDIFAWGEVDLQMVVVEVEVVVILAEGRVEVVQKAEGGQ